MLHEDHFLYFNVKCDRFLFRKDLVRSEVVELPAQTAVDGSLFVHFEQKRGQVLF